MSIANFENMISNAERRAAISGTSRVVPRIGDLAHIAASTRGKMELALSEEVGEEDQLLRRIVDEAIGKIFAERLNPKQFRNLLDHFEAGQALDLGDALSTDEILARLFAVKNLRQQIETVAAEFEPELAKSDAAKELQAAVGELILHGMYASNRINRQAKGDELRFGS